ncbi:PREDICTED: E3 ubiquitin-protein ligase RNF12-A-like isoform X1 [Prunus mume]|uniref:E3 ubiquitin-protein ligase RNF12-A-like isoform X1 n=2 Tax=Prunus mume TaxID=102107 RepID=A0ABM0PQC1_PRUMU|nr:PREDICTED: E3 ubiquitin-protein ligase RNF12-A-like isoform X1 [Prunus mume]
MGSSSSRLGSRPSRARVNRTTNRSVLSSFVCGGSSSRSTYEMEDHPAECLVKYAEQRNLDINQVRNSTEGTSLVSSTGARFTCPIIEIGSSSESTVAASQNTYFEDGLSSVHTSNLGKCLSKSKELISPHQVSADYSHDESCRDNSTTASTSFKEQQSSDPVSVNCSANMDAVNGIGNSADNNVSQTCPEVMRPSSSSPQGIRNSRSTEVSVENHVAEVMAAHSSNADTESARASETPSSFHSLGNDSLREAIPSGLGFLVSNREQGEEDGSILHVDVMSISSNLLSRSNADASNREARRNGRRLFWDAFSRRSSRRFVDSPTILLSTDDTEDLGFHDRWLLGLSGDFFDDGIGADSGYQGNRIPNSNERRRHSRSEVWERLRVGLDDNGQRNTSCPTGIHPRGMCSCGSFLTEESSTRASISRIVMLAEALFEVLDEIHRQPVSLSLSMVSVPAPASVVDSFPLKSHTKVDTLKSGDDVAQCYICLAEYEEGDKIRVLPCHHEYHMSCVDKWLKEIHGVCPLCRGDVREGIITDCSVSNSEISSV